MREFSAEAPPAPPERAAGAAGSGERDGRKGRPEPTRPLVVTGGIAAWRRPPAGWPCCHADRVGWITAPHVGIGTGLGGVLRTAAMLWLVAHHVGFTVRGAGRIGLLPLGLVLLPGALLAGPGGGWCGPRRHPAAPRRLRRDRAGAAVRAAGRRAGGGQRTAVAAPSLLQAVIAAFLLALVAGGLGAARGLAPWSRPGGLMPARPRSIVMGMLGSAAILAAAGAVLAGASLAVHLPEVRAASDVLAPGVGGAVLLLLAQLAYVPNSIIWAVAYMLGPGFAFGTGTGSRRPARPSARCRVPDARRPCRPAHGRPRPGLATVRCSSCRTWRASSPGVHDGPDRADAGARGRPAVGLRRRHGRRRAGRVAAAFSGGPLGTGAWPRSARRFQVGLVAILEIGITAALTAGRGQLAHPARPSEAPGGAAPGGGQPPPVPGSLPPGQATRPTTPTAPDHVNPWAETMRRPGGVVEEYLTRISH